MLVRFTRPYPPYNPGEVAGFSEAKARQLLDVGAAVKVEVEKSVSPSPVDRMVRVAQPRKPRSVKK